jgi:hypothetical protein
MTNEISKKTTSQTKTKLGVDILIFVVFLVMMDPRSSGIAVHEWLAISVIAALIVHLLLSWDWITQITRRLLGKMAGQTRINYILNWLLFIDGTLIMVSGIMISQVALPTLGLKLPAGFAWRGLHDTAANFGLVLLGLHTALHWAWVVNTFNKYLVQPVARLVSVKQKKDASA